MLKIRKHANSSIKRRWASVNGLFFLNGRDKSRQTTILKKSTTTLSLQNMFRSIIDHRQLQVVHDEFEFHLKLQCELTLLRCR